LPRRFAIREDLQEKYGFAPLGDANSATKRLIFAADNTRPAFSENRLAALKTEYAQAANQPTNLRYGYVRAT
jgi:uncharacterized protein